MKPTKEGTASLHQFEETGSDWQSVFHQAIWGHFWEGKIGQREIDEESNSGPGEGSGCQQALLPDLNPHARPESPTKVYLDLN